MADVNITAINPRTKRVTFALNIVPKKTRGIETLLQLCAKTILTTPGRDVFAPIYGGGLMSYHAKNLNVTDIGRIKADIAYIVRRSEEQILYEQAGNPIALSERLASLTLLSCDYIEDESALDAQVLVTSGVGDSADISLANQIRFKRNEDINVNVNAVWRLHEELQGIEQQVMEYLYAYGGRSMMTVREIAQTLKLPEYYVIDIRNRLSIRLKEISS